MTIPTGWYNLTSGAYRPRDGQGSGREGGLLDGLTGAGGGGRAVGGEQRKLVIAISTISVGMVQCGRQSLPTPSSLVLTFTGRSVLSCVKLTALYF